MIGFSRKQKRMVCPAGTVEAVVREQAQLLPCIILIHLHSVVPQEVIH